ncbi:hypothetical protein ANN_17964 [Periplaneta americana]|uniref:Uncharacterized protein n=1 Tax=Periplaneta americana TaxID=6978 RepID=A0ABQ8SNP4_PERAM|nr:hypothetical protein ANN_17964 [Periplaneta americana]
MSRRWHLSDSLDFFPLCRGRRLSSPLLSTPQHMPQEADARATSFAAPSHGRPCPPYAGREIFFPAITISLNRCAYTSFFPKPQRKKSDGVKSEEFGGHIIGPPRPQQFILPVVLYGCETWTLTLREEQGFGVFENKVLRKIFGAKRDEVTGEWRKLHNTELHALYSSPDIIRNIKSRRLRWAGHVARMGESRNAYRVLVGRPEGKIPLGRPRRRWEDNIKMDLREVGYDDREWINLAQDRDQWRVYVKAAMNLRIQSYLLKPRSARLAQIWSDESVRGYTARLLCEAAHLAAMETTDYLSCSRKRWFRKTKPFLAMNSKLTTEQRVFVLQRWWKHRFLLIAALSASMFSEVRVLG